MPRIRTVKPELWSSPDTAACEDPWARLLFIAMWNWADDNGRGTANPKELAGFAFPNDDKIDAADVRRMLGGIRRAYGVKFYVVHGRPYYEITSWNKHQKLDKRCTGRYPAASEGEPWNPDPDDPSDLPERHESVDSTDDRADSTDCPADTQGKQGVGSRKLEVGSTTSLTDAGASAETVLDRSDEDAEFAEFWSAYPRKVGKPDARKKYRAARKAGASAAQILASAQRQIAAWRVAQKETQFIPHPATWLHQARYDDEPEQVGLRLVNDSMNAWAEYAPDTSPSAWSDMPQRSAAGGYWA